MFNRKSVAAVLFGVFGVFSNASFANERNYDCLAGTCINSPVMKGSALQVSVETVGAEKWQREVVVCSGKIVEIAIMRGWSQSHHTWDKHSKEATVMMGSKDATMLFEGFMVGTIEKLVKLGWYSANNDNKVTNMGGILLAPMIHPNIKGGRVLVFTYPTAEAIQQSQAGWMLGIMSMHPERDKLCEAADSYGL